MPMAAALMVVIPVIAVPVVAITGAVTVQSVVVLSEEHSPQE